METHNQDKNYSLKSESSSVGAFIWDLVKIVAISMAIIIPFRLLVAEPFVVSGSSMVPNFHNSDYLIVDRVSYHRAEPKRGDVIVMKYPKNTAEYFIKRIVGLPGETVMLQNGKVVIVNKDHPQGIMVIDEPYLPTGTPTLGRPGPYLWAAENILCWETTAPPPLTQESGAYCLKMALSAAPGSHFPR